MRARRSAEERRSSLERGGGNLKKKRKGEEVEEEEEERRGVRLINLFVYNEQRESSPGCEEKEPADNKMT